MNDFSNIRVDGSRNVNIGNNNTITISNALVDNLTPDEEKTLCDRSVPIEKKQGLLMRVAARIGQAGLDVTTDVVAEVIKKLVLGL